MSMEPQPSGGMRVSRRARPWLIAAASVVVWLVLVLAADQLWYHAFGFTADEALMLAVSLIAYLGVMLGFFALIAYGLNHEGHE